MSARPRRKQSAPPSRWLESFLEMMAAERGASQNTIVAYLRDLREFEVFMFQINRNIEIADAKNIQDYLAHLQLKARAPSTHARKLSVLKQFYQLHLRKYSPQ